MPPSDCAAVEATEPIGSHGTAIFEHVDLEIGCGETHVSVNPCDKAVSVDIAIKRTYLPTNLVLSPENRTDVTRIQRGDQ